MNSTAEQTTYPRAVSFVIEGKTWSAHQLAPGVYQTDVGSDLEYALHSEQLHGRVISIDGERVRVAAFGRRNAGNTTQITLRTEPRATIDPGRDEGTVVSRRIAPILALPVQFKIAVCVACGDTFDSDGGWQAGRHVAHLGNHCRACYDALPVDVMIRRQEEAQRRAREAPLVALVANVPEGFDATGWRAAVLTYAENYRGPWWRTDEVAALAADLSLTIRGRTRHDGDAAVCAAYARAIAAQGPRPKPERKGSTWRERGPRIVCDHGED